MVEKGKRRGVWGWLSKIKSWTVGNTILVQFSCKNKRKLLAQRPDELAHTLHYCWVRRGRWQSMEWSARWKSASSRVQPWLQAEDCQQLSEDLTAFNTWAAWERNLHLDRKAHWDKWDIHVCREGLGFCQLHSYFPIRGGSSESGCGYPAEVNKMLGNIRRKKKRP